MTLRLIDMSTGVLDAARAEDVRRRFRARYPILNDGMLVEVDGRLGGDWFARSVLGRSLVAMRLEQQPERRLATYTPADLLPLIDSIDQTPIGPRRSRTEIILMEVGPRRLHAYWHLAEGDLRRLRSRLGQDAGAPVVLRLHDVTAMDFANGQSHHSFDVDVDVREERRYIELWSPDREYLAQIGLRAEDGRFLALAQSNAVHVPRDAASEVDARRINVASNMSPIVRPAVPQSFAIDSPRMIAVPGDRDWPGRDCAAEREIRKLYLEFLRDGPRVLRNSRPLRRPDAARLRAEYHARQANRSLSAESADAGKPARKKPPALTVVRLDAQHEWMREAERKPRLPSLHCKSRISLQDRGREERAREVGRLTALLARRETPPQLAPLALPLPATDTTPAKNIKKTPPRRKPIRINRLDRLAQTLSEAGVELEAELILRGRVKPGKKVRIGGRVIQPQPDGSFCVSCVVRDGKLHVPVEVVEAETVVVRQEVSVDMGVSRPVSP